MKKKTAGQFIVTRQARCKGAIMDLLSLTMSEFFTSFLRMRLACHQTDLHLSECQRVASRLNFGSFLRVCVSYTPMTTRFIAAATYGTCFEARPARLILPSDVR